MAEASTLPAGPKQLIVLGCSSLKRKSESVLPAISLYDGPTFRVLRAFLREFHWPTSLSVAILPRPSTGLLEAFSLSRPMTSE